MVSKMSTMMITLELSPSLEDVLIEATKKLWEDDVKPNPIRKPFSDYDAGDVLAVALDHPEVRDVLVDVLQNKIPEALAARCVLRLQDERGRLVEQVDSIEGRVLDLREEFNLDDVAVAER